MLTDAQLLAAVLTNDDPTRWRAAWREFVRRYHRLVASRVGAILRLGGATGLDDVDDVIGDVWLALVERNMARLRSYNPTRGPVSALVGVIATRIAIDRLRQRRETVEVGNNHPATEADASEETARLALVWRAMEQLSERERAFARRVFAEEQSPAQVAADLGVSVNAVHCRRWQLRQKLARLVAELA